jgi:hypothetical protein
VKKLTPQSGTATSMQFAILGRFIAGIGSSGITDLITVIITGNDPIGWLL